MDTNKLAEHRDSLYKRLEAGYTRIEKGLAEGADVTTWEDFWVALLDEYQDILRQLDAAPITDPPPSLYDRYEAAWDASIGGEPPIALVTIAGEIFRGNSRSPGGTVDIGFDRFALRFAWIDAAKGRYLATTVSKGQAEAVVMDLIKRGWEVGASRHGRELLVTALIAASDLPGRS